MELVSEYLKKEIAASKEESVQMNEYEVTYTVTQTVTRKIYAVNEEQATEEALNLTSDNVLVDRYTHIKTFGGIVHNVQNKDYEIEMDYLEQICGE